MLGDRIKEPRGLQPDPVDAWLCHVLSTNKVFPPGSLSFLTWTIVPFFREGAVLIARCVQAWVIQASQVWGSLEKCIMPSSVYLSMPR